jgi:putative transcriptional regulator
VSSLLQTRIKEYRAKYNLSQDELAERVDARRETINRLEKGIYNPSLKLAMDIAKVLNTTVEEIFRFKDDE